MLETGEKWQKTEKNKRGKESWELAGEERRRNGQRRKMKLTGKRKLRVSWRGEVKDKEYTTNKREKRRWEFAGNES